MQATGLVAVWTHGDTPAAPFEVAHDELPARMVWSGDGKILWTAPRAGLWSAWDPDGGARLRRSYLPEDTRVAVPLPEMVDLVLGPVVRRGQRDRVIVAWSPDAARALTVATHRTALTLRAADGSVIRELKDCHRPAAFSPDGTRIACTMHGQDPLVVLGVEDGEPIAMTGRGLSLYGNVSLMWPTNDTLLLSFDDMDRNDHRLLAFSLREARVLWERPGRWFHIASDGNVVIARDRDDTLVALDLVTGSLVRQVEEARWLQGPLGCGEPDTIALLDRLLARPIRFSQGAHVTGVRVARDTVVVFHGWGENDRVQHLDAATGAAIDPVPLPWSPPTDAEKERARAMLRRPADFIDHRLVAPDGSFVLYAVSRNVTEVPDPDAGSVVHADMSLALWDRESQAWRWETTEGPPEYTLTYTADRATFTLGTDSRGILVDVPEYGRSSRLYDVATGNLRPIAYGDVPSFGPCPTALAVSRSGATLIAEDTRIELRDGSTWANPAVDFEDDRAVAAAFLGESGFVVATARGRVIRFTPSGITKRVTRTG